METKRKKIKFISKDFYSKVAELESCKLLTNVNYLPLAIVVGKIPLYCYFLVLPTDHFQYLYKLFYFEVIHKVYIGVSQHILFTNICIKCMNKQILIGQACYCMWQLLNSYLYIVYFHIINQCFGSGQSIFCYISDYIVNIVYMKKTLQNIKQGKQDSQN